MTSERNEKTALPPKSVSRRTLLVTLVVFVLVVIVPAICFFLVESSREVRCDPDGQNCDPFSDLGGEVAVVAVWTYEFFIALVVVPIWLAWRAFRGRRAP